MHQRINVEFEQQILAIIISAYYFHLWKDIDEHQGKQLRGLRIEISQGTSQAQNSKSQTHSRHLKHTILPCRTNYNFNSSPVQSIKTKN